MSRLRRFRRVVRVLLVLAIVAFFLTTALERRRMAASAIGPAPAPAAPSRVDREQLVADMRAIGSPDLGGRQTGSEGNRRAREFILERFRTLGLSPVKGTFEQKFSFTHRSIKGLLLPSRPFTRDYSGATNVMAMVEGSSEPDRFVLVSAHYDHLGVRDGEIYPGADDNASGVAALLAAASWFRQNRPLRSVLFVSFDAEELGLQGARHFVTHPPVPLDRIVAMVNMDMVGRGDDNTLVAVGTYYHPELQRIVAQAASGRQITVVFGHDRPLIRAAHVDNWTQSSDQGPFHSMGVPFLYFGVEDHEDYHQPTDTAAKIPVPFFVEAVNLVVETVNLLANTAGR